MTDERWPELPLEEWQKTYATLHMWMQIIGKVRLATTPLVNHWWNVPFYVSVRGLSTSRMWQNDRGFEIEFDFVDHYLVIRCDDGTIASMRLRSRSVADFYRRFTQALRQLKIDVKTWPVPVEVQDPVPFENDDANASYDRRYVVRLWRILASAERVFTMFRARFVGKCSPVHFFWGSFDLAVTRFSGRRAPEREGADRITREAYSHEVISHGFWPGMRTPGPVERIRADGTICAPAFYSYTAPEPAGLARHPIRPKQAFYSDSMKEFILFYDDVRTAPSPEDTLMEFLQSTYEAGADLANWNREELERAAPALTNR